MTDDSWPSRFGSLGDKYGLNEAFKDDDRLLKNIISDEMPPTRNPLNPKEIFTSKAALRQRYKEAGVEEVGTAYDNGYNPEKNRVHQTEKFYGRLFDRLKYRLNHG